jgi:hypothetical protein
MSLHVFDYVALGIVALSVVFVVGEIALKDSGLFRQIVTDVARMAQPEPARTAEIHELRVRRPAQVDIRKAA